MQKKIELEVLRAYPTRGGHHAVVARGRRLYFVHALGAAPPTAEAARAALVSGHSGGADDRVTPLTLMYGVPRGHASTPRVATSTSGRLVRIRCPARTLTLRMPGPRSTDAEWRDLFLAFVSVLLDAANDVARLDREDFERLARPKVGAKSSRNPSQSAWSRALSKRESARKSRNASAKTPRKNR